jgi:hypothetical protein
MAMLARTLLGDGRSPAEVLRECYGVPFPDEVFVLAAMLAEDRAPPAIYTNRPWRLLIPLDRGGPPEPGPTKEKIEARLVALDAELIPLLNLRTVRHMHGGSWICYRSDELAAGRSTIVGVLTDFADDDVPQRYGDSLTTVIHEHFADGVRQRELEFHHPSNVGAGSLDEGELASAHRSLARADELVAAVAERKHRADVSKP